MSASCAGVGGGRKTRRRTVALLAMIAAMRALAMHIVLTNDDGFESRGLQALFAALQARGDDVILSAPYRDWSGASAQAGPLANIPRTSAASPGGTLAAGVPGVGPTTLGANQYYVDGTPVGALLYALDVLAPALWGAAPDLVISGPNIGNNLGAITPHSGTVGAAVTALNRGVPAIALSAASDASLPLLTALTLRLVGAVEREGRIALPPGAGLTVNFPALDARRTAAAYRFVYTKIGYGTAPWLRFTPRPEEIPGRTALPAVNARRPDDDPASETNAFADGNTVTVSPLQGSYQAAPDQAAAILAATRGLFGASSGLCENPKMVNIALRGYVGAGSAVQIAGFVIAGTAPKTVLLRASGAGLATFGVAEALADPAIELFDRDQRRIGANENWDEDPAAGTAIAAAAARVGAFAWPAGSKDAALLITLPPGSYSLVVKGTNGTTGVALVEVFDLGVD